MWYSVYLRVFLLSMILVASGWQFFEINIGNGIFLFFIAMLFGVTIYINEVLIIAFLQLRKGNLEKAEKFLNYIKKPSYMKKTQEAYFHYLRALIISQKTPAKSEALFKKALNLGLRMRHDKAMAKLNLAGIAASKRKKREAINWLNEAKKLDNKKMLADQIKMMKKQLSRI